MKISKKELNQIIKEEADRFLKIQSLKSEKERIQQELNENYSMEEGEDCAENEGIEEGLMDMFKKDPKKGEEAIALAKKAIEAEIDKGEMIEWKGIDNLTTGKVVRELTDEEKADLKSRVQSFVDNVLTPKNKWDGLDVRKQDIRIVDLNGKPKLAAAYKDRKLAGISGKEVTESDEPINENDIRKIFREESRKSEEIKKLKKEANKIISEIKKIG